MSQVSPILSLPYLQPSQAQKHVTLNEALQMLDLIVQLRVESLENLAPPTNPTEGQAFIPANGATDAWAGHAHDIAVWRDSSWLFFPPQTGWRAWDIATEQLWIWTGTAWIVPSAATDNLSGVGIGTSADSTNVLAASGPATLLTHAGAGHQLKINKNSSTDTSSLLFQSGWAGHAEMGLAGDTDFSIKVSADGNAWTETLKLQGATGRAGFGASTPSARVHVNSSTSEPALRTESQDAAFDATAIEVTADRAGDAAFEFARFSSSGHNDAEFIFAGDGNATCDGSWTGGGADYAEYFEWSDGNPDDEDRRGMSVVLVGEKIRPAQRGEDPIGVISATPSVIGDGDTGRWKGKYLRDAFGSIVSEEFEVASWQDSRGSHSYNIDNAPKSLKIPNFAERTIHTRRKLNPDFVSSAKYVPRSDRAEWAIVGLMGKLRIRVGQPTRNSWIRMRRITDTVEEWLIR